MRDPLIRSLPLVLIFLLIASCSPDQAGHSLQVEGLHLQVEVIRDSVGINHIYAANQHDLFFTQGYLAARDRLFQFEIWRRQATGTVAEILGERELKRDIGTRLFKFRGDMEEEMDYYHEDGSEIISAYTRGVNAYIKEVLADTSKLTLPFRMLGILPQYWTEEVVISRHQGLLGNIGQELETGIAVAAVGPEVVKKFRWFHPRDPDISLDSAIAGELLSEDILELYDVYRRPVRFQPEDLLEPYRASDEEQLSHWTAPSVISSADYSIGSNNWVVSAGLTSDSTLYMANDPHRTLAIPSLRYMVHLNAPGWNVIGGGEPEIPGVSIGHNEHGAWGLTVFRTDGEDLMVYDIHPDDPQSYFHDGKWKSMQVIEETFHVKDSPDTTVSLYYTHHGPVTMIDSVNDKAYAVRCAWLEPGGSPYLASLRMDQATTFEEFREACNYSHIPGENMVWADKYGHIGWQAVGIAPLRRNYSGLVPVPGDGRYEWDGYLPIIQKPNLVDPTMGFIATANENVVSEDYDLWDAIGFNWADPYRGDRVREVLREERPLDMDDMKRLQTDYLSIPARTLVPMLLEAVNDDSLSIYLDILREWDHRLEPNSIAAGIYVSWENALRSEVFEYAASEQVREVIDGMQLYTVIEWLRDPGTHLGPHGEITSEMLMHQSFLSALETLAERLGPDVDNWQYGQEKYKHVKIFHPLGKAVADEYETVLNTPAMPRGGNSYTPGSTGGNYNQSSGATFRIIADVRDWDASVGTNSPGQSGDPEGPFYMNLFNTWARDIYFPLYFSREKVEDYSFINYQIQPK